MTNQNENQPAYPCWNNNTDSLLGGLTKLELVAAMAMQGALSNSNIPEVWSLDGNDAESAVKHATAIARALLAACAEGECCHCQPATPSQSGMTCLTCGRKIKEAK